MSADQTNDHLEIARTSGSLHRRKISHVEGNIHDFEAERFEIETFAEFEERILGKGVVDLSPYVFQEVDFRKISIATWRTFNIHGAWFIGCQFPEDFEPSDLTHSGALVLTNNKHLPFKPFRAFLYRQTEMAEFGDRIYHFSKLHHDLRSKLLYSAHDFSISDALYDCVSGKTVVSFMGGHAVQRADPLYHLIVRVSWSLARSGFLIATGGGPGAMEAGNLGAYLAAYEKPEDVEEAIRLISTPSNISPRPEHEYLDPSPARAVLARFGPAHAMPSLGVPTFFYGHEPSNLFASCHAKYFDNAIREDMLIKISNGGIIFAPGSAGTRSELFQSACLNHYADPGKDFPMIFLGSEFWSQPNIYDLFVQLAAPKPFHKWIIKSDSPSEIVQHLKKHAEEKELPLLPETSLEDGVTPHFLRSHYFESSEEI